MADMRTPSPTPVGIYNRFPNLNEVLNRQTLPPVDLYHFYIFMRDQKDSVDYLDFWLDVSQHMALCRHYVRELRRSVLVETPELEKAGSKRSSQVLDRFGDLDNGAGPSNTGDDRIGDQHVSSFLRQDNGARHSPQSSMGSQQSAVVRGSGDRTINGERPPRPSFMSTTGHETDSSSPLHTVARQDIRNSAEKILYTYLLPGSEREILLNNEIVADVTAAIEEEGRDDPEVFDAAKDYVYQAMERDAYQGFLFSKGLGNLVPASQFIRLCVGLAAMFGGFWAAFACIFLDKPKHIRCWVILPFTIGVYLLSNHQYNIDPILAFLGISEITIFKWARVREPYVHKMLVRRAAMIFFWTVLAGVAIIVLFVFVPGKRL